MFEKNDHSRIRVIFLAAIIILLLLSIFSYVRIKSLISSSEWVNHSTTVKLELENTFSLLNGVESAQRGFFLSNDTSFLEYFALMNNNINVHLDKVDSLTQDNPTQRQNIKQLRLLIKKRIAYLKSLMSDSISTTLSPQAWKTGKILMDDVRNYLNKIEQEEDKLFAKRSSSLYKETILTPLISIILMIIAIGMVMLAYYRISADLKLSDKLKSDLQERSLKLQKANEALEEKNKELESFTYISSHDLQEPLRKIQTLSSRIGETEKEKLSDMGKNYFLRLENAASRMQTLIQDLLAYSRTRTEERKFEMTDLKNIVEEVKDVLEEEITAKNAIIETGELCEARIIPFQFHQLLHNLVSNAIKFSRPGIAPQIMITSRIEKGTKTDTGDQTSQQDYCHITVRDNGIGFDPKYKDVIFEVFQRLHGKDEYEGTGIGLAIVKKIVENHSGYISASGELNKGTSFDIYIPA